MLAVMLLLISWPIFASLDRKLNLILYVRGSRIIVIGIDFWLSIWTNTKVWNYIAISPLYSISIYPSELEWQHYTEEDRVTTASRGYTHLVLCSLGLFNGSTHGEHTCSSPWNAAEYRELLTLKNWSTAMKLELDWEHVCVRARNYTRNKDWGSKIN